MCCGHVELRYTSRGLPGLVRVYVFLKISHDRSGVPVRIKLGLRCYLAHSEELSPNTETMLPAYSEELSLNRRSVPKIKNLLT